MTRASLSREMPKNSRNKASCRAKAKVSCLSRRSRLWVCLAVGPSALTLQRDTRHGTAGKLFALEALSKGYIKHESLVDHIISEKNTMQMLDSPFSVRVYQTYRDEQYVCFLMEPACGGEIFQRYSSNEHLFGPSKHAEFYMVCVALGLQYLHSRKIVYHDLRMENVLLYDDG